MCSHVHYASLIWVSLHTLDAGERLPRLPEWERVRGNPNPLLICSTERRRQAYINGHCYIFVNPFCSGK
jgi:hypothetical protein